MRGACFEEGEEVDREGMLFIEYGGREVSAVITLDHTYTCFSNPLFNILNITK